MSATVKLSEVKQPRLFRFVEIGAVLACIALDVVLFVQVARGLLHFSISPVALIALAVGAYLTADFVTGLVHFVGDSFGTIDTPVLGRTFVLPFRSHHDDPGHICEHDFVETNGNNAFATLFGVIPTLAFAHVGQTPASTAFGLFVLVFSVLVMLTNQIHKWAHVESPPRVVRVLQRAGILLSPEAHESHHAPPYGRGYCVCSGIFNRLLDPIGFFPFLERVIRAVLFLPRRAS